MRSIATKEYHTQKAQNLRVTSGLLCNSNIWSVKNLGSQWEISIPVS
jgi:hypothetical protein